jgi:excisionase family DNA binding protein
MAARRSNAGRRRARGAKRLYTLSEVAREVGISMPTAQKYKKRYQNRIPSEGSGRRQRYPQEALAVFAALKRESAARSGRPRRAAGAPPRAGSTGTLSLAEVARRTGISYPTLLRYLRLGGRAIPQVGRGRRRRFPEAALAVFVRMRAESRRGPRPAAGARAAAGPDRSIARRLARVEAKQAALSRQVARVLRLLERPLEITLRRRRR